MLKLLMGLVTGVALFKFFKENDAELGLALDPDTFCPLPAELAFAK